MLRQRLLCLAVIAASCGIASAQTAFTTQYLDVFAGPANGYPLVARLGPGAPVQVMGCLSDWSWCDIVFAGNRGWAYSPDITYTYQGSRVPLYNYLPRLGIPIVTFSLGSYWDRYYRGRPWYSQRNVWMRRAPPPRSRPVGPPAMRPGPARPGSRPGEGPRGRPDIHRPGPGARPGQDRGNRPAPGARPGQGPGNRQAPGGRGPDHGRGRPDQGQQGPPPH